MRKKFSDVLWGIFWIGLGVMFLLSAFDVWEFSIGYLLNTWWPMFIIIPCFISMVRNGFGGGLIGFVVGILLLLNNWGIIEGSMFRKMIIPVILILIGLSMIIRNLLNGNRRERIANLGANAQNFTASFATQNYNMDGQPFFGAKADAAFGTVVLDIRNAIIGQDVVIQASAVFGHVSILVPQGINVKVTSSSVFGGVDNKTKKNELGGPTIFVDGSCVFGGVTVE